MLTLIDISGLAVVFAEDIPDVASANPPNSESFLDVLLIGMNSDTHCTSGAWSNLCPEYNANNPDTQFA